MAKVVVSRAGYGKGANDLIWICHTTTPVDGTSGTGAGLAGKGSLCTAIDTGKLYVNGGTKSSPTWKIVTSAS